MLSTVRHNYPNSKQTLSLTKKTFIQFQSNLSNTDKKSSVSPLDYPKATWNTRREYAEDNALLKNDNCFDLLFTSFGMLSEYLPPLKLVFGPILITRFMVLYTLGLFASSKTIYEHFQKHPLEKREITRMHDFLWRRC